MKYGIFQATEPASKVAFGFMWSKGKRSFLKEGGWFDFEIFSTKGEDPYFVGPVELIVWRD
jgi:hypothetical protein